jgi:hypothetical protein
VYAFNASSSAIARADLAEADVDVDDAAYGAGADATRSALLQAITSDSSAVVPAAAAKRVDILGT